MEGLRRTADGRGTFARIDRRESVPLWMASRGLVAEVTGFNRQANVRVAAKDARAQGVGAAPPARTR
jgi:hypothetical protein